MQSDPRVHSDEFLRVVSDYDRLLILTHDNPDPDAIATGWAMQTLIREKLNRQVRLIGRGEIVRAENRHMLKLLGAPIELVQRLEPNGPTAAVLVDCTPGTTDHLPRHESLEAIAVVDHHPLDGESLEVRFQDVRPDAAASATIAASYLREQGLEPDEDLATALLYAIRTETRGHETLHSPLDHEILSWLTELANPTKVADIESAPLAREYFGDLVLAVQSTFLYDDVALCLLPRAHGPEIVGEVADLLIRCEGVQRVLCGAVVGEDILFSARTARGHGNAAHLLRETLKGLGVGGGHPHRAGGKIPGLVTGAKIPDELEDEIRNRWLAACDVRRQRGTRLVAKRQIVANL